MDFQDGAPNVFFLSQNFSAIFLRCFLNPFLGMQRRAFSRLTVLHVVAYPVLLVQGLRTAVRPPVAATAQAQVQGGAAGGGWPLCQRQPRQRPAEAGVGIAGLLSSRRACGIDCMTTNKDSLH